MLSSSTLDLVVQDGRTLFFHDKSNSAVNGQSLEYYYDNTGIERLSIKRSRDDLGFCTNES
jgi:hypothetical protein